MMEEKNSSLLMQNKVFLWLAAATGLILLLPITATLISNEFTWKLFDFIIMAGLLFGTGSLFVLVARRLNRKYLVAAGITFAVAFLWIWAELAVGVFTNWGS